MQGFRELIQLHLAHQADRDAGRRQDELKRRFEALERSVAEATERLAQAEGEVKRLQLERRAAELEVQKLEDQRTKFRAQLMTAKTNEVYKTLLSEIATAGQHLSARETVVLEVLEAADASAHAVESAKRELAAAEAARAAEEKRLLADIATLAEERQVHQARAAELEPSVERSLLAQYQRLREARDGRGLALAVDSRCTACHIVVRPQTWVNMLGGDPELCAGCKRILYREDCLKATADRTTA